MNILKIGLDIQSASLDKGPLAQESIFTVPCKSCGGFGRGEDQDGRSTGMCPRCDGSGWVDVIVKQKQEKT